MVPNVVSHFNKQTHSIDVFVIKSQYLEQNRKAHAEQQFFSATKTRHLLPQRDTANNQSVRRHLDAFTRGRIIGKLEEGRSVTSVAAEFGIAHSIVSRLWRQFQTTGTAIRGFSSGRPRGTTPADDRYIVLQVRRNRRQTAGEIARHTTQATGQPISRFTVARRLHGGGLFARHPVRCVPLTPAHRRRRSLWCREHRNWRDNEWGRVLFTYESRFSLSSDSHRILIWRERGSRKHPSNIIERDRYGGRGVLVWGGIMLGSRTHLHIFDAGSVNGTRYCNEILLPYVRLFRGAMGLQFLFMDDNAPGHRTVAAEQLLESEDIERMDWPARSPDLNPIEHVWDFLGRRLAARTSPPVTIRELRLALQDEWAAMPQQLIDTLILSMGRRCETCLASSSTSDHTECPSLSSQSVDKMLKEVHSLIDGLKIKDEAIKGLQEECTRRLDKIQILQRSVQVLQDQLTQSSQHHNSVLIEKENLITQLQHSIKESEETVRSLLSEKTKVVIEGENTIQELQEIIEQKDLKIKRIQSQLEEALDTKETELQQLRDTLDNRQKELDTKQRDLEEANEEIFRQVDGFYL
ncbi:transposable element Tcb2 transposase [Trichonephila clavipes]|nr:transposable element Tcb2 transposase [Trichonephila clavipes]